ncbi:hypothetical protein CC1G_03679 [Coprinopsis cinerea okayama7|uniref:Uncharacterized protein n=1 Tax=Coprinopsis cinerea (strain Okayama-7 / 130 / ATCC MYA-4618 / FGSC 9003) TaxID=240176 RepID=A8N1Y6_COPC7|nr:hypothetical protein CC1G_03679 [Coprinopsis cinerea okayama7\|eukprot:XP_001828885.1 hypothetical protein CC1G_03679 [Coprinopsis cinerea okayama7\
MARPPYYILVALNSTSQPATSNNLRHPAIQYHYTDDSPLALLPQYQDEHVLILNHGQDNAPTTVHSISQDLITTGLKVDDAPGAAVAASSQENVDGRDDRMYIIETTRDDRPPTPPHEERKPASAILAQFKARNDMIRHALNYPSVTGSDTRAAPTNHDYTAPQPPPEPSK